VGGQVARGSENLAQQGKIPLLDALRPVIFCVAGFSALFVEESETLKPDIFLIWLIYPGGVMSYFSEQRPR